MEAVMGILGTIILILFVCYVVARVATAPRYVGPEWSKEAVAAIVGLMIVGLFAIVVIGGVVFSRQ
jgi:hypothetical protein